MKKHIKKLLDEHHHMLIGESHGEEWDGYINSHTMKALEEILSYLLSKNKKVRVFYEGSKQILSFPKIESIDLDTRKMDSAGRSFTTFCKIWGQQPDQIRVTTTALKLYESVVMKLDSKIISDYQDKHDADFTIYVVGAVHAIRIHDLMDIPMVLAGLAGNYESHRRFIKETRSKIALFDPNY